jgi:signal peptidase II
MRDHANPNPAPGGSFGAESDEAEVTTDEEPQPNEGVSPEPTSLPESPVAPGQIGDRRRLLTRAAAVVAIGVVADQLTKWLAVAQLEGEPSVGLLPTLQFTLHYNTGFSFGTGQGAGRLIGLVVIAMTLYLANMIRREIDPRRSLLLAIVLSGALGNLIDRIVRAEDGLLSGAVVDFIDVTWFAIFNVADIFVVCGVIVFGLFELLDQRQHREPVAPST